MKKKKNSTALTNYLFLGVNVRFQEERSGKLGSKFGDIAGLTDECLRNLTTNLPHEAERKNKGGESVEFLSITK